LKVQVLGTHNCASNQPLFSVESDQGSDYRSLASFN